MSVPCEIEVSSGRLPVGPSRVVPDGGGADEQGGTLARRHPRPRRPRRAAGRRGGLAPGLSGRQVFRLLARLRAEGASGLASRRRGGPGTRRLPAAALGAVRERYADFGPPLAAEKLEESHDIRLSRETLR